MESLRTSQKLVAAGALGIIMLSGCDEAPNLDRSRSAEVVEHDFKPATIELIDMGNNTYIPVTDPEEYDLKVKQCGHHGEAAADSKGCITTEIQVDESIYNQVPDGQDISLQDSK